VAAVHFLTSLSSEHESDFRDVALENEAVLHLFEIAAAPVPVAEPSAYLLDVLQIVGLLRDAIFAAMLGGQARFATIAHELRVAVAHLPDSALKATDVAAALKFLTKACDRSYHAELLEIAVPKVVTQQRKVSHVSTVMGSRATARYLGTSAATTTVPSPRNSQAELKASPEVELTGVGKLAAFTQQIVTALCELLYFYQGDAHMSIGRKEEWIEKLRRKVPMSPQSQAPVHCYLTLRRLADEMDALYVAYEPRWAAALQVVVYYLRRELPGGDEAAAVANVAETVPLCQELVQFCRDIQLDRCVLAAHVHEAGQLRPRRGKKTVTRGSEEDVSPSPLALVKHLTAIRTRAGSDEAGSAEGKLRAGLDGLARMAEELQSHAAVLSLDIPVAGAERDKKAEMLRELPLGALGRAVAQTKMLLQAVM
jgi:hypothetical protein